MPPSEHEHKVTEPIAQQSGQKQLTAEDRAHFVHWVALPCLGAALTTGFGFLMLAFNELQPARELGIELFLGSILAFVGAYLAWMWFAPFPAHRGRYLSADRLEAAEHAIIKRPLLMTSIMGLLMLGLGYAATHVRVDADPFSFFRRDSGPGIALSHFSDRKFGYYILDVVCIPRDRDADGSGSTLLASKHRERMQEFEGQLQNRPEVRKVISTAEWRKRLLEWTGPEQEARQARKSRREISPGSIRECYSWPFPWSFSGNRRDPADPCRERVVHGGEIFLAKSGVSKGVFQLAQ